MDGTDVDQSPAFGIKNYMISISYICFNIGPNILIWYHAEFNNIIDKTGLHMYQMHSINPPSK